MKGFWSQASLQFLVSAKCGKHCVVAQGQINRSSDLRCAADTHYYCLNSTDLFWLYSFASFLKHLFGALKIRQACFLVC